MLDTSALINVTGPRKRDQLMEFFKIESLFFTDTVILP